MIKYFFKYTNKEWLDQHSYRVGTLLDYRRLEHGEGVTDPEEGIKYVDGVVHHWNSSYPERDPMMTKHLSGFFARDEKGNPNLPVDFTFTNIKVVNKHESENFYIYSLSDVFDPNLLEKYDSCLRINNIDGFMGQLSYELNIKTSNINGRDFKPVVYGSRHSNYQAPSSIHPALLKDKETFGHQREWRIVWNSIQEPQPETLVSPKISQFVELIYTKAS